MAVTVTKMSLVVEGRPDVDLDLTQPLSDVKNQHLVVKEGAEYRLKFYFLVNHEIVPGLKVIQKTSRKGIKVDSTMHMVGSYGGRDEPYVFLTSINEAPIGMLTRGTYLNESFFTDVDKKEYLQWEWNMDIKKDWE